MPFVIAVDGPAASGKGTIAQTLARDQGLAYLDTGLLYRAVGLMVSQRGGDLGLAGQLAQGLPETLDNPGYRTREAGEWASRVAEDPTVRAALLAYQKDFAQRLGGAVLDGRDIGTVIAPDAPAKLFVTAAPEVRAERRWRQLEGVTLAEVLDDIRRRDERDEGRGAAPMRRAEDAVLLDTSDMDIAQAVEAARRIVETARARLPAGD